MGAVTGNDATDIPLTTTLKQGLDKRVNIPRIEGSVVHKNK